MLKMALKGVLIGKGQLTPRQERLLQKALQEIYGESEFEFTHTIETLNSPRDLPKGEEVDFVVSFIMHPTIVNNVNTWKKFNGDKPFMTYKIQQLGTFDEPKEEIERKADIKYVKETPAGKKYVYSKTEAIIVNPKIEISYEREITDEENMEVKKKKGVNVDRLIENSKETAKEQEVEKGKYGQKVEKEQEVKRDKGLSL